MAINLFSRRTVGLVLLLCVVLIWVGSSFLVSNLFGQQEYNRPFFITYINTGTFSLYLAGVYLSNWRKGRNVTLARPCGMRKRSRSDENVQTCSDETSYSAPAPDTDQQAAESALAEAAPLMAANVAVVYPNLSPSDKLSTRETIDLGIRFCILWFAANATQNASLAYTSVANSSILCSTSGLFTLIIGALGGVEQFNFTRLAAVLISILGVYSIVKYGTPAADASAMPFSWLGDMLALSSAALYGCYTTLLKRRIGDESRLDTPLFFGAVGLANLLLLWPGFLILQWTGIEPFQLPQTATLWIMILVNALIGTFLSDYLWLKSMLMTSPLVVTLGLSLTIPLSMAGDIVFK
ncbi:hypothetical protein LPJ64_006236, partial [Coemansia asiatica]